jgi:hypothetical protein
MSFPDWLEEHLGVMAGGFVFDSPPDRPVQIARFEDQPVAGAFTLITTGISKHVLHQSSGNNIRLELLMCAWRDVAAQALAPVLFAIAQEILGSHHAPSRGTVLGPREPLLENATVEAILFTHPGYHAAELDGFDGEPPETIVAWALPVTSAEANLISAKGYAGFESLLEQQSPDLMDFFRPSMV